MNGRSRTTLWEQPAQPVAIGGGGPPVGATGVAGRDWGWGSTKENRGKVPLPRSRLCSPVGATGAACGSNRRSWSRICSPVGATGTACGSNRRSRSRLGDESRQGAAPTKRRFEPVQGVRLVAVYSYLKGSNFLFNQSGPSQNVTLSRSL